MTDFTDRIVPLDDLDDYEVAEGDPDVRGWDVIAADGRKIGSVDELLVDTAAMRVRYLDVDLDQGLLVSDNEERHVLIPIGFARLDENDDQVLVDHLPSTAFAGLPVYTHEPLTREYEMTVVQRFSPDQAGPEQGAELYDLAPYDDRRFYGGRRGDPLG